MAALQRDLNRAGRSRFEPLASDGIFGPLTEQRVYEFQKARHLKYDGKVGPETRGALDRAISGRVDKQAELSEEDKRKTTVPVPSTPVRPAPESPVEPSSPHVPRRVDREHASSVRFVAHAQWDAGLIGDVVPKATFRGPDGRRLVVEVFDGALVYMLIEPKQGNKFGLYAQTKSGFVSDVKSQPFSDAAKGASGMVTLARFEGGVLLGIAGGIHWSGFVLTTSLSALRFVAENQHKFQKWRDTIAACIEARDVIRRDAPTFYEIVLDEMLFQFIDKVFLETGKAVVSNPEKMGKLIGRFIGKAGAIEIARNRLWTIWHISTYILSVAWEGFLAVPEGVKGTAPDAPENDAEMARAVAEVHKQLKAAEGRAGKNKVELAMQEVRENHKTIIPALRKIAEAAEP